jgi:hypothetical protein
VEGFGNAKPVPPRNSSGYLILVPERSDQSYVIPIQIADAAHQISVRAHSRAPLPNLPP